MCYHRDQKYAMFGRRHLAIFEKTQLAKSWFEAVCKVNQSQWRLLSVCEYKVYINNSQGIYTSISTVYASQRKTRGYIMFSKGSAVIWSLKIGG